MTEIKVSDYIAEFLRIQQTTHVFEVAGGIITHLLDSLYCLGHMQIISVHHEQAAAFAADAYGRCVGRPGVALATSGPGATNLLTGIASCYFDSSPALFITGQVNRHEQKGIRGVRQLGFQETDIVAMAKPVTKQSLQIQAVDQVVPMLHEAYQCALDGRPGPVLLDIPMDIQYAKIKSSPIDYLNRKTLTFPSITTQITSLLVAIKMAKRPLILAGQGIACARAKDIFLQFVERAQIPVVTSLLALDVIPFDYPLRVGFIGTYGNRWANLAIGEADLLIVIGSRLDIRQTGADVKGFQKNKTIFHIDCDVSEINNRLTDCIPVLTDIKDFLTTMLSQIMLQHIQPQSMWLNHINTLKTAWPDTAELKNKVGINPNQFMHALTQTSKEATAFVADVGNHQMWAAQSLEIQKEQLFMTSGGLGAMGFALPAAMGASFALGKKPVVAIVGDGALQMNIQELQTIVRNRLPIKIIVMNNQSLGMIRQFQDSYFAGRYQSTYWGYTAPDFSAIAEAYGISAKTLAGDEDLTWLWQNPHEPQLLQVMVDAHTNVYPKIAFGKPITEMEPLSAPIEMEGT